MLTAMESLGRAPIISKAPLLDAGGAKRIEALWQGLLNLVELEYSSTVIQYFVENVPPLLGTTASRISAIETKQGTY